MSIPLIQKPEKDDINTSIIAIKRNIERINMLLGLSNSEEIDTSEFVKKSDIVDVVEADNMNPVTSNAVAVATQVVLNQNIQLETGFVVDEYCRYSKIGRLVIVDIGGLKSTTSADGLLWTRKLPVIRTRFVQQIFKDNRNTNINATVYGWLGSTNAFGHFPSGSRLYGNFVYITD